MSEHWYIQVYMSLGVARMWNFKNQPILCILYCYPDFPEILRRQNVAYGKPTKQKSSKETDFSAYAVNGLGEIAGCSSTPYESDPWWMVDLNDKFIITAVTIATGQSGNAGKCFNPTLPFSFLTPQLTNIQQLSLYIYTYIYLYIFFFYWWFIYPVHNI